MSPDELGVFGDFVAEFIPESSFEESDNQKLVIPLAYVNLYFGEGVVFICKQDWLERNAIGVVDFGDELGE